MPNMLPTAELSVSDSEQHRITAQNRSGIVLEEERKKRQFYNVPIEKPVDARVTVTRVDLCLTSSSNYIH